MFGSPTSHVSRPAHPVLLGRIAGIGGPMHTEAERVGGSMMMGKKAKERLTFIQLHSMHRGAMSWIFDF